jgi:hypothetical protein
LNDNLEETIKWWDFIKKIYSQGHTRYIPILALSSFFIGVVTAIMIPINYWPRMMQDAVFLGIHHTPNVEGLYYYVTTKNTNNTTAPFECDDLKNSQMVSGTVKIGHDDSTLAIPSISFLDGKRKYCLSTKDNTVKGLQPHIVAWESIYTFYKNRKITAILRIHDGKLAIMRDAQLSGNKEESAFSIRGEMDFWSTQENQKTAFATTIRFTKCKPPDDHTDAVPTEKDCDEQLDKEMDAWRQEQNKGSQSTSTTPAKAQP